MIEKFFTTEQVANILQVHPFTILKFIRQGKLQGVKLGRVYRIKESDVKNFLEERMTGKPKKVAKKTVQVPKKETQKEDQEIPHSSQENKEKESDKEETQKSAKKHFNINESDDDAQHYYVI